MNLYVHRQHHQAAAGAEKDDAGRTCRQDRCQQQDHFKWETAKGLPDISLLEPLSAALGVSVMELMKGDAVINQNRSANLLRSKLYVCPSLRQRDPHPGGYGGIRCCGVFIFRLWRLKRPMNTTRSRSSR